MRYFDPDTLATFLAFADTGSLSRAAGVVGRTPSAITAQMQRLEEVAGGALFAPAGRGKALTPLGQELVGHARHILEANRQAVLNLGAAEHAGQLVLGLTQDFAATELADLLRAFTAHHPRLRLDLRIGRSQDMKQSLEAGQIDVLIAMRSGDETPFASLREQMIWIAAADGLVQQEEILPLALLDPPCSFRAAALKALEAEGRVYHIAATSQSLAGLITAVKSGLAITVRTPRSLVSGLVEAPSDLTLPQLPECCFGIYVGPDAHKSAPRLAEILAEGL